MSANARPTHKAPAAEERPTHARWGVRVRRRDGETVTSWFWWEGASAAYAGQARELHGNAELVSRTQAEALAAIENVRLVLEGKRETEAAEEEFRDLSEGGRMV